MLLRKGCAASYLVTRVELRGALKQAFATHYFAAGGRLVTPPGSQNVTPDCTFASAPGTFPLLAEVGQSQTVPQLNERANVLLQMVPGARVVILIKIFDTSDAENGRMVAWCATHGGAGIPVFTPLNLVMWDSVALQELHGLQEQQHQHLLCLPMVVFHL